MQLIDLFCLICIGVPNRRIDTDRFAAGHAER